MAPKRTYKSDTKAKAIVHAAKTSEKEKQLQAAVEYCMLNKKRGYSAIKNGICPLISDARTINARLDGKSKINFKKRQDSSILTLDEERCLVRFILNKNRACQGISRGEITNVVHDILILRKKVNKTLKGGRKYIPLSRNAQNFLQKNKLSKSFWRTLEVNNKCLTRKRQGSASSKRAVACTKEMAINHIDELASELINTGIFKNAEQVSPGKWTGTIDLERVFNHDEMPQFINYGVNGHANGLVYCGKGDKCERLRKENRECVTLEPFVSLNGDVLMLQTIFPATNITSHMAPPSAVENIPNLLISTTQSGYQDHNTCLESYKLFDKVLTEKKVQKPVVVLTDGHASRFDPDVMRFCREHEIYQFLSPPDTTNVTQLLDQLFVNLHSCYRDVKDNLYFDETVNRECFMDILSVCWGKWTNQHSILNAARKVGITKSELNVDFMDQKAFKKAETVTSSTPVKSNQKIVIESPVNIREGSAAYWKSKYKSAENVIADLQNTTVRPDEVLPELFSIKKTAPKKLNKVAVRVTQAHGSMEAKKILEKVSVLEEEKKEREKKKEANVLAKSKRTENFLKCQHNCICQKDLCDASGYKMCPKCQNVLKGVCGKMNCRGENGQKPCMILPACNLQALKVSEVYSSSDDDDDDDSVETSFSSDDSFQHIKIPNDFPTTNESSKPFLVALWTDLSPPTNESEIIGKWFAGIYLSGKKVLLYVGRATKRFINDVDSKATHIELDLLKLHQPGGRGYIECIPEHLEQDLTVFPIYNIIAMITDVSYANNGRWFFKKYAELEKFFNLVKKIDRKVLF